MAKDIPPLVDDSIPHGLTGYRKFKCKCDVCLGANRDYNNEQREKRDRAANKMKPKRPTNNVRSIGEARGGKVSQVTQQQDSGQPRAMGVMELAVLEETSGNPKAIEHPAMVQAALAMARVLDDPKQIAQYATCNRQLMHILEAFSAGTKKKSKGRLARVQSLTSGKVAAE